MNTEKDWQKNYPSPEEVTEESLDNNSSLRKMLDLVGNSKEVVDFGCATGYFSKLLQKKGCMVTGVEINIDAAKVAEKYCHRVVIADLDFVSIRDILPSQKFDVAVFGDILEHLRDPWKVLTETKEILKEDGYVIASIPNIAHAAIRLSLLEGRFDYTDFGILDNTHLRFFTRKTVNELFIKAGYLAAIVDCTKLNSFSESHLIPYSNRSDFNIETIEKIEEDKDCDTLQFIVQSYAYSQSQLQHQAKLEQLQLQKTQTELERSLSQSQQDKAGIKKLQSQFQQAQAELERSLFQSQQDKAGIEKLQSQLQQTQAEIEQTQYQLKQICSELKCAQFQSRRNENEIEWMKTSKFWKLRTIWFKLKPKLKLTLNFFKINIDDLEGNFIELAKIASDNSIVLAQSISPTEMLSYKERTRETYDTYLQSFINSRTNLKISTSTQPLVSIILVLYNRAELTLQCLLSLNANCKESYEIIIVDNASTDATRDLLKQLEGVSIIYNNENVHFLLASNQAAKEAKGEYILFLNNDAQVLPGSITSAIETISKSNDIGAVGGKIILLDGSLQEAGSIIWNDGSCLGYGRGDSPFAPMYMFKRDVDYCSGAFLLTKRHLFINNGGFDEDYQPAYYEETDYCLRLWRMNQRVVYDPNAVILHYEFASSESVDSALSLQSKHRDIFVNKHREKLLQHHSPDLSNTLVARDANNYCGRVLVIDDRVPHLFLGSGFPRSQGILHSLVDLNYCVTFFPLSFCEEDWNTAYQDISNNIEIMLNYGLENFQNFLFERRDYYDIVFISRPHNFRLLKPLVERKQELFPNVKFIYDAEALFSLREISRSNLIGEQMSPGDADRKIAQELELPKCADRIVSVSAQECQKFSDYGYKQVYTLGHSLTLAHTKKSFEDRADILFVGAIYEDDSPNADSILWFVSEVLPLIKAKLNLDLKLNIVGPVTSTPILDLSSEHVKIWGQVDSLDDFFNNAKIFIAPTRFAAGIPIKVCTSAGYGLPVVATSLIASQLNWKNEVDLLTADDRLSFAEQCIRLCTDRNLWQILRDNALNKVSEQYSKEAFNHNLKKLLTF